MFGFRREVGWIAGVLAVAAVAGGFEAASAQSMHRTRRESNANRQARIARATAQTYGHRWEVGGGGGWLRFRSGEFKMRSNEVTFWLGGTYSLTPKLGILADVNGAYGSALLGNNPQNARNPVISEYLFTAGPTYRVYAKEKYSASVFGTAGAAMGRFGSGYFDFPSTVVGLWPDGMRPAFTAGVNLDYNLFQNFAFRVTPRYVGTTFGGTLQSNKGVNAGVIYRFGKR